jgi:hypothetical protein
MVLGMFEASRIVLPDLGLQPGGYGSALVAVGEGPRILLSLHSGAITRPWACVDLLTGEVEAARGLRGEVRDGLVDADGRGWLLTASALVRVDVSSGLHILDTLTPKGVGKYQSRLLPFGDQRLGVVNWMGNVLSIVDLSTGALMKKLKIAAPHMSRVEDRHVTLFSPHGGERLVVRRDNLARVQSSPMPTGTAPWFDGADLVMVTGTRAPIPRVAPTRGWTIARHAIGVFDAATLAERLLVATRQDTRDVLGVDRAGRLVLSTDRGFFLADRDNLAEVARFDLPTNKLDTGLVHRFVPMYQAVAMASGIDAREIVVVRW